LRREKQNANKGLLFLETNPAFFLAVEKLNKNHGKEKGRLLSIMGRLVANRLSMLNNTSQCEWRKYMLEAIKQIKGTRLLMFMVIFVLAGLQAINNQTPNDYIAAVISVLGIIKSLLPSSDLVINNNITNGPASDEVSNR
jgi:hypothetical protein